MDKTDLNREKYRIVYTYYAKPIAELAQELSNQIKKLDWFKKL